MFTEVCGRRIEYLRLEPKRPTVPRHTLVFLHEGLGSVSMWRGFPQQLVDITGLPGLVYSRYGHGQSEPLHEPRDIDYQHVEARKALPELLGNLGIASPLLFGHSDGASIALMFGALRESPAAGLILLAPHVRVEQITVDGIAAAREAFRTGDLRQRLSRYHVDVDSTFTGWNDIWLDPRFRDWNIEACLPQIACPILAIQGKDDEYGTLEQIRIISRLAPRVVLLELDHCGHSPHRDQPAAVLEASRSFVESLPDATPAPLADRSEAI